MKTNLLYALTIFGLASGPGWAGEPAEFTAHEWGTFTSAQGADGAQREWNPLARTDLPSFVYDLPRLAAGGRGGYEYMDKAAVRALIRMETPVIYFYSPVERRVDVRVDFPQGQITEWYPRASGVGPSAAGAAAKPDVGRSYIEWAGLRVLAPGTAEISADRLVRGKEDNHYYAARQTQANLLRVGSLDTRTTPEYERLLFYRGVGHFRSPLRVTVSPDEAKLVLSTASLVPLTDLFALTIRRGQAQYSYSSHVSSTQPQEVSLREGPFSPLTEVQKRLRADVEAALVRQGLYPQEAAAMVNTWKDQWFADEGTRVLFLLPRESTDRALPLTITPAPAHVVRVMVGRSEVILPSVERELHKQIVRYSSGDHSDRSSALAGVRGLGLGRFLGPAIERVLQLNPDQKLAEAAWRLAEAVGEETSRKLVEQAKPGEAS